MFLNACMFLDRKGFYTFGKKKWLCLYKGHSSEVSDVERLFGGCGMWLWVISGTTTGSTGRDWGELDM